MRALLITALLCDVVLGFMPLHPVTILKEGNLTLEVNPLRSAHEAVPLPYYDLPVPQPKEIVSAELPNLGQILMGDKPQNSLYNVAVLANTSCRLVGTVTTSLWQRNLLKDRIDSKYRVQMLFQYMDLLENKAECLREECTVTQCQECEYRRGLPLGEHRKGERVKLWNHYIFNISYNTRGSSPYVVGFTGKVQSYKDCSTRKAGQYLSEDDGDQEITYTYDVIWSKSDVEWAHRWDAYLSGYTNGEEKTIIARNINLAALLIITLSVFVAIIMLRTLHLDCNRYNNPDNEDEMQEEVGWKLIHTEVFRPPEKCPNCFAALIGTSVQVTGVCLSSIFLGLIGFTTPAARGSLIELMLFVFVFCAFVNGYTCARLQMHFGTKNWRTPILSGLVFPGCIFFVWGINECLLSYAHSTSAVGFSTLVRLLVMWFMFSLPLVVFGASNQFKAEPLKAPIPYRSFPRQIPPQSLFFSWPATILIPGLIPFMPFCVVFEIFMSTIWQGKVYSLMFYIAVMFILSVILIIETVLVYIYHQLVYEDYRWWWKSFFCCSGVGFYFFLWSFFYRSVDLPLGSALSKWLFLTFCAGISVSVVLVCGCIGFYTSWMFINKIYNSIKIE